MVEKATGCNGKTGSGVRMIGFRVSGMVWLSCLGIVCVRILLVFKGDRV